MHLIISKNKPFSLNPLSYSVCLNPLNWKPVARGKHYKRYKSSEAAHGLTVLWKTTLWPLPTLSMWVVRLRQMALWRIASMVWASKKSWGLAGGVEGQTQMRTKSNKHNTRVPTVALIYKNSMAFPSFSVTNHKYLRIISWLKNAIPLWFLNVALQQQKCPNV